MGKTVYLVSGYEISEDGMLSLLYEPSFNKYVSIAKSGLASALKEYYAAPTNSDKVFDEVIFFKGSRMIYVDRRRLRKKNFEMDFKNDWLGLKK